MKQVGILLGLVLAVTSVAQASPDDEVSSDELAFNIEEGSEYLVDCTETGVASGLTGDDLDAYVQDCMDEVNPDQGLAIGE